MKIYSEKLTVTKKEERVSPNGKPYYLLNVKYVTFSQRFNCDREMFETLIVPQKVFDNVEENTCVRLVGVASYSKDNGQKYNFYDLYESKVK